MRHGIKALIGIIPVIAGLLSTSHPTQAQATSGTFTVPASIPLDCSRDVTADLVDFIASIPDGTSSNPSVISFRSGDCYRVDGTLLVDDRNHLTLDGNGARIDGSYVVGSKSRRHLEVNRGSHVTIREFEIKGDHALAGAPEFLDWDCPNADGSCEGQHGIAVYGTRNAGIFDNYIHNVYGDLIYLSWKREEAISTEARDVGISGNTLEKSGRQGITLVAGDGVTISGNYVAQARANLLDLEAQDPLLPLRNVTISGNRFGPHRTSVLALSGAGACGLYHDVTFTDNTVEGLNTTGWANVFGQSPDGCPDRHGLTITDNSLLVGRDGDTGDYGIKLNRWDDVIISGNSAVLLCESAFACSIDQAPVSLTESEGTTVSSNVFAPWKWVYETNNVIHGPGVASCGNTSAQGSEQPVKCSPLVAFVDSGAQFHLYDRLQVGAPVTTFYYGNPGDVALMGDWNCDGVATPAMYRPSNGFMYLRNSNTQGVAEISYFYGNPSDIPIAGDFDGDGCDTLAIYRPSEGKVYIKDSLGTGVADYSYYFGNPGDRAFTGDFNGDGVDTVGLHRESTGFVYFRNSNTQGVADFAFFYGDPGDKMLAGDWDANGTDTLAVYRPSTGKLYVKLANTQGVADFTFTVGAYVAALAAGQS
jgi:hypothetical protein